MNYQVAQYRNLTSPIKTWMFEFQSSPEKAFLRRITSASSEDRQWDNDTPANESLVSFKTRKLILGEEQKEQKIFSTPERNYDKFPERIRNQIKFFETGFVTSTELSNNNFVKSRRDDKRQEENEQEQPKQVCAGLAIKSEPKDEDYASILEENKELEPESILKTFPTPSTIENHKEAPILNKALFKEDVIKKLREIHGGSELREDLVHTVEPILTTCEHETIFRESTSLSRRKNEQEEKFIVNLYERKSSKNWPRVKAAVGGGIVRLNSKLYIKGASVAEEAEHVTSASGTICTIRNSNHASDIPEVDMVSRSITTVSPDKLEASVDDSLIRDVDPGTENLEEVHNQCRIMQEATKAVEICRRVKEFTGGREQLEAERILLLAGLKRNLLLNQSHRIQDEGPSEFPQKNDAVRLTITNLEFPLILSDDHREYELWYIITCSCEFILQASQLIPRNHCHFLNFTDSFVFENVDPNAVITLNVYQTKIQNNLSARRRRLQKLNCLNQTTSYPRESENLQYKDLYSGKFVQSKILPPIFTLCGSLEVTMDQLVHNNKFLLTSIPNNTTLFGSLKQLSYISINLTHSGFLVIGVEQGGGSIVWERKWCRLNGAAMKFWDHPREEVLNTNKLVVELTNTIEDVADEYISRRHVLVLKGVGFEDADVCKLFLAADSSRELKNWKKTLSFVLTTLRLWKCVHS